MSRANDGKKPAERLNWVDRIVAFARPQAGLIRMAARQALHEFGYSDDPTRRGDSGGQVKNAPAESYSQHRDRIKAMWDARDLATYDWIGGVLARVVLYVCGELECKSNTGVDDLDSLYDEYFHNWCGDEQDEDGFYVCDLSGRHRLLKLIQIALLAMFVDGDHGMIIRRQPQEGELLDAASGPPCVQLIEADRIGSPIEAQQQENYIGGFTIDVETGKILSIRVFRRTRMGMYVEPREIEPANFIHLWDPDRGDHYRGRTLLLRVLPDSRDIREWIEAEKIAGKTQSQFAGLVGTKDPYAKSGVGAWEGKTKEGTPTQNAMWGKILKMAEGESFSLLAPPNRPSGGFMAFIQMVIRKIAVALGFSYGFVWDLASLGGVTARVEVRADERRINYYQRLLVGHVLRRIRKIVLAHGVAFDGLPAHPQMNRCTWHFGARIITDVGYEVQNDLSLLNAGLVAADDVATKYSDGGGLREIADRNATIVNFFRKVAAENGVPIEMLARGLWPDASQLLAAMNSEPAPPPKPGSLEAVGDKGAGQIVDLLSKVTTGQMERETAVQALVTVYGIPAETAESIVPAHGKPVELISNR